MGRHTRRQADKTKMTSQYRWIGVVILLIALFITPISAELAICGCCAVAHQTVIRQSRRGLRVGVVSLRQFLVFRALVKRVKRANSCTVRLVDHGRLGYDNVEGMLSITPDSLEFFKGFGSRGKWIFLFGVSEIENGDGLQSKLTDCPLISQSR